jgi:hypothetical protein
MPDAHDADEGLPAAAQMDLRWLSTLRWLVVLEIVLVIFSIAISILQPPFLPPLLQQFEEEAMVQAEAGGDGLAVLQMALLALPVVAWVSLWKGWRNGRKIYTVNWLVLGAVGLFSGAGVRSAFGDVVETGSTLVAGMIFGILYFSEARHYYEVPAEAEPAE